jgi:sugar O-acyltransferase (sialic acid O-acetyltransferase NeuD family)
VETGLTDISGLNRIIIVGYSGHAFVALDILQQIGTTIAGYCDTEEKTFNPYSLPYLGNEREVLAAGSIDVGSTCFFIGIGHNATREKVYNLLVSQQATTVNAIHPGAIVSGSSVVGIGVLIAANATINPLCNIGNGVICNTACVIDHECVVHDFAHICPGTVLCGNVTIGRNSFIGANSVVRQGITICDNVIIGAGSTVVKDILVPGTYYGGLLKG